MKNPFENPSRTESEPTIDFRTLAPKADNPFGTKATDGRRAYVLVRTTEPVDERVVDHDTARAARVETFWKGDLLRVDYVADGERFPIGDLPGGTEGATGYVEVTNGRVRLELAEGRCARVFDASGDREAAESVVDLDGVQRAEVVVGALLYRVSATAAGRPSPRAFVGDESRHVPAYFALSLLAHVAFITSLAAFVPDIGLTEDEGVDKDRAYLIQQYLESAAERDRRREQEPETGEESVLPEELSGQAAAADGPAGTLGRPEEHRTNGRLSVAANLEAPSKQLNRAEMIDAAKNFGMIGLLATLDSVPSSPFASFAMGNDEMNEFGSPFDTDIGERRGTGGLSLSGPGLGGGGTSDQIRLGLIGMCKGGPCNGRPGEGGFGPSGSRVAMGDHKPTAPNPRPGVTEVSGGSLPATVIQRVVRQNFGRFRQCYETGLMTNPNLEGRVTARFVIARDGSVATVQSGGSDLPNAQVVSCVLGAYRGLSFPAPEKGIVTVSYPLVFSPA